MLGLVILMALRRREADTDPSRMPGSDGIVGLGLAAPPVPAAVALPSNLVTLDLSDRNAAISNR